MSFRKPYKILREMPGSHVNGLYLGGARFIQEIQASVQPTTLGRDLAVLPEGRHLSDFVKAYTSTKLSITSDGENTQPDIIIFQGYGYEIMSHEQNQSDVIAHHKYIASKVFKYTSDAEWLNGTLVRPVRA